MSIENRNKPYAMSRFDSCYLRNKEYYSGSILQLYFVLLKGYIFCFLASFNHNSSILINHFL